jgi:ABC-type nitrate/sulfonate/bicarbonate transport system ATPase subunit
MAGSSMITFTNVSKQLGGKEILKDVSFHVKANELAVLTGNSGSGKTTLLRLIAGTLKPDSGNISISSSQIGFIFQDHRLLPWKTALDNIALVLRAKGMEPGVARKKANDWLERLGLEKFSHYYPAQLSGGMVQRVSIARAFAVEPDIILMDEPFSNLDAELTDSLLLMTQQVLADYQATVIYVTHDVMEALRLADRLFNLIEKGIHETPIEDRQSMLQAYCETRMKAVTPNQE